jgi:hypothetical protein
MCTSSTLLPADAAFKLPVTFNYTEYLNCEQELWAFFPECTGKRVNFLQAGLSAFLYAEVADDGSELANDETYVLMPQADKHLRPIRMKCVRRITLEEYRLSTYTAIRAGAQNLEPTFRQIATLIAGNELLEHIRSC